MTKQEQINEMTEFLDEMWIDYPPRPIEIAEALYNAGYSKDYISEERAREIGKEMFDKVRKETAKEILQQIHNLCKVRDSIQFDDIYYLVNRYGVEIEE